jgi:hypothetical protein
MTDDDLRHNYLERKRRDEIIRPVDTLGAQERTGARLASLFGSVKPLEEYEREIAEAERFAFDSCVCAGGKPMEDWQQRMPGVEHLRNCPQFEPRYKRGNVSVAMLVCDVDRQKVKDVLHVLDHLDKPEPAWVPDIRP